MEEGLFVEVFRDAVNRNDDQSKKMLQDRVANQIRVHVRRGFSGMGVHPIGREIRNTIRESD